MFTNRPALKRESTPKENENQENLAEYEKDFYRIRDLVQRSLLAQANIDLSLSDHEKVKQIIEKTFNDVLEQENILFNYNIRQKMLDWVNSDIIGYGPIEPLLNDPDITEIMVNGHDEVFVERFGIIEDTNVHFEDEAHLRRIIERIVSPLGRRVDETMPMVDARLPSGYRVNATIPPLSLDGPILTIRKFAVRPFTAQDLIANSTMSVQLVSFLKACVEAKINIVISGGTGSGKTTLFNKLTGSNQHVGNFPGVTIEKKEGQLKKYKYISIIFSKRSSTEK